MRVKYNLLFHPSLIATGYLLLFSINTANLTTNLQQVHSIIYISQYLQRGLMSHAPDQVEYILS